MYRLAVRLNKTTPEVREMCHGHPRTTLLQEGWRGGQEPSSAGPPALRMSATVAPAASWVCRQVVSCQPDLGLSARAAREFSARIMRGWGLPVLADDVAVIVSELVSNALRHGVRGRNGAAYDRIELILWRRPGQIICAVTDPGTGTPVLAHPDLLDEAGRGLHVVEALSATWGWTRLGGCRKAVWAAVGVPGAEPGPAGAGQAEAGHSRAAWECRSRPA
jgi:anti-sigma regulatory factor (Ser/Thr protein kinase)